MAKFLGPKYVPKYQKDYFSLPWYERELMISFNHLDQKDMAEDPDHYFKNKKVVNFDLIYHEARRDPLQKSEKERKSSCSEDFKNYPSNGKKPVLSSMFRNPRDDLWIRRDVGGRVVDYGYRGNVSVFLTNFYSWNIDIE